MFDAFWSDFKWKIFGFCFVPYLIYFSTCFMYLVTMLYKPDEEAPNWDFSPDSLLYMDTYEAPLLSAFIILLFFQMGIQVKQMISDGVKRHLYQTQNIVDIISYSLNLTVIICRFLVKNESMKIEELRLIGAVAGLFLWFQIVFWLRLFDNTAQYVSLVLRTVGAIFSFMIVMIMMMFAFGTATYILQLNRIYGGSGEDELLFRYQAGDYMYYSSIINQYLIVLGDFEGMNLNNKNEVGEAMATIFFTLSTFLSQITILNMLIAIMGDTFSKHTEEQDVKSKQQKLLLLSEYIDIVEFYQNRCLKFQKNKNPLFVYVVTTLPDEDGDENDGDQGENQLK